jgi:hypothetical protein
MIGENGNSCKTLVAKSIEKGLLGRQRRNWEETFKLCLREIDYDNGKWKKVSQDGVQCQALIIMASNLRVVLLETVVRK